MENLSNYIIADKEDLKISGISTSDVEKMISQGCWDSSKYNIRESELIVRFTLKKFVNEHNGCNVTTVANSKDGTTDLAIVQSPGYNGKVYIIAFISFQHYRCNQHAYPATFHPGESGWWISLVGQDPRKVDIFLTSKELWKELSELLYIRLPVRSR